MLPSDATVCPTCTTQSPAETFGFVLTNAHTNRASNKDRWRTISFLTKQKKISSRINGKKSIRTTLLSLKGNQRKRMLLTQERHHQRPESPSELWWSPAWPFPPSAASAKITTRKVTTLTVTKWQLLCVCGFFRPLSAYPGCPFSSGQTDAVKARTLAKDFEEIPSCFVSVCAKISSCFVCFWGGRANPPEF